MTVFEELTKGMKFSEPVEDIKKNMVKVFEKNFRCPPWNDVYEEVSSTVRLGDALIEKPPKKLPTGACTCWRLAKSCRKSSAPEPNTNRQRKASQGRALSATVHDNLK